VEYNQSGDKSTKSEPWKNAYVFRAKNVQWASESAKQ
jgi:hypothetical protein